jgi:HK97 family phage major capsid protein
MPLADLTPDERLIQLIHSDFKTECNTLREEFKKDFRALAQRSSRPPGSADPDPDALFRRRPSAGLSQNAEFGNWIASSTKTRRSSFAAELPFEIKVATPTTGVGLPSIYPQIYGQPPFPLRLQNLLFRVPVETGSVIFTRETAFTPAAALVAEATRKPQTGLSFQNQTLTVQTIANFVKVSIQALRDTPLLESWVDARLSYSCLSAQEAYLLNDSVTGLITLAGAATVPAGTPTSLDLVASAIGQLTAAGFTPDGVILNPADVTATRLLKNTQGNYLWGGPDSPVGTSRVWNLPLIESPSIAPKTFLVGAFSESAVLFDRQILIVEISFENEDDFVNNLATLRGELRCVLGVPLPSGLLRGTLP